MKNGPNGEKLHDDCRQPHHGHGPPACTAAPLDETRILGHVLMALWIISGVSLVYYLGSNVASTVR